MDDNSDNKSLYESMRKLYVTNYVKKDRCIYWICIVDKTNYHQRKVRRALLFMLFN